MNKFTNLPLLFLFATTIAFAQTTKLKCQLVNSKNEPVAYAAVIIQDKSNEMIASQLSDSLGVFVFSDLTIPRQSRLIIQHIVFESDTLLLNDAHMLPPSICLKERSNALQEVVISAKTPLMKIKDNAFVYNIPALLRHRTALNVYETVRELPGVIDNNKQLILAGSSDLLIVIDGQLSNMSKEQVQNLLKAMPASKIKEIEVMYHAPAKYNTQGAVINITLKDKTDLNNFAAEAKFDYAQSYYDTETPGLSLSYNHKKVGIDVIGNFSTGRTWNHATAYSLQTIQDIRNTIDENTTSKSTFHTFNTRIGVNYRFSKQSRLTFSYYFKHRKDDIANYSEACYNALSVVNSRNRNLDNSDLHNINLQYKWNKLNVGADFIYYRNPATIDYIEEGSEQSVSLRDISKQQVSKYALYANHTADISKRISLSYGLNMKFNRSKSRINYYFLENKSQIEDEENRFRSTQKEIDFSAFAELQYNWERLSVSATLKSNYFKSDYDNADSLKSLWNSVVLFPGLSVSYHKSNSHDFQWSFTTNRRYPSYWAVNPQTTNMSSYTSISGNPELKPSKSFNGQFVYTLLQKYMLIASVQYNPDFFTQIPHMSEDQLKMIYRYENFDYRLTDGITLLFPVEWAKILSTQCTVMASRTTEKIARFYGSSFNNTFYDAYVSLNNSLQLSSKWLLQVNLSYRTPSRQGVYKLGESYGGNTRLRYKLNKDVSVTLRYDNLFQRAMPNPMVMSYGSHYRRSHTDEKSEFGVSVIWNLNRFKSKKYNTVDTKRLDK